MAIIFLPFPRTPSTLFVRRAYPLSHSAEPSLRRHLRWLSMATARAPPPPPVIGKAGSYTIFITPSSITPPSESLRSDIVCPSPSSTARRTETEAPFPAKTPPSPPPLPPVQVPPPQFEKTAAKSSGSVLGFFWEAVAKVQNAHSSLDEHLANWFGLDHSRYQWALNDYYESSEKKDSEKVTKPKELVGKGQAA